MTGGVVTFPYNMYILIRGITEVRELVLHFLSASVIEY